MASMAPFEHVTAAQAAARLDKSTGTIYSWGTRYKARKVQVRGVAFYDLNDLKVIDREIRHGHKVPATPEQRAEVSQACPLKTAERTAHAA